MAFKQNEKHKKKNTFSHFSSSSYCREASSFNMRIYKELLSRKIFFVKVVIKRGTKHKKFSEKFYFPFSATNLNKQAKKKNNNNSNIDSSQKKAFYGKKKFFLSLDGAKYLTV